jgi:hypothetical protein
MLFELKNTSVTFQRLINDTLREYLNDFVITYLDDILIYSDDLETLQPCAQDTEKLNERTLYVKKSKSRFETKKIEFLIMLFNLSKSRRTQRRQNAVRN